MGRRGEEWLAVFEGAMAALWEVLVEVSVQGVDEELRERKAREKTE